VNGVTIKYYLDGDKVVLENTGTDSIYYSYDADDKLVSMTLNNTEYFYFHNGQGDITGLIATAEHYKRVKDCTRFIQKQVSGDIGTHILTIQEIAL
jgi:YD repeat-containing protein